MRFAAETAVTWSKAALATMISLALLLGTMGAATAVWLVGGSIQTSASTVEHALAGLESGTWSVTASGDTYCRQTPVANLQTWKSPSGAQVVVASAAFGAEDEAKEAYAKQDAGLATCSGHGRFLMNGFEVSGLGDQAMGLRAGTSPADKKPWTMMVTRSGKSVFTIESSGFDVDQLAVVLGQLIMKSCSPDSTCAANPVIKKGAPPPVEPRGWLIRADLPLVNPGPAKWEESPVDAKMNIAFTQCEGMSFDTVEGPTERHHRAFLLLDDPKASEHFGIDEVMLTLKDEKTAKEFANTLTKNISQCEKRFPMTTVQVEAGGSADRSAFSIRQEVENKTIASRLSVVRSNNRVAFLYANSQVNFDFTSDQWRLIGERAQQRLAQ